MRRSLDWVVRHRWHLAVLFGALVVRLHWNLVVHPPGDYIYSDMNGYITRADRLMREPWTPAEYNAFFPWGTHALLALLKAIFGSDSYRTIGAVWAVMGSVTVLLAFAIARRASAYRWVPPAVGLVGIFYYPHFSIGGYFLSEPPFSLFVMLLTWHAVRLAEDGRARDAVGVGLAAGIGTILRPQMMVAVALFGLFWLLTRKHMPKVRWKHMGIAAIPLVLVLGISAAHFRFNTGTWGLVSQNGPFNLVFGRCHNSKIESLPDGKGHGKVHFRPPEFLQLNNLLERKKKEGVEPPIKLDPIIGDVLSYKGYIGDASVHHGYVRECLKKTGVMGQLRYTWTNIILLWKHNIPWPDSGKSQWRTITRWWTRVHEHAFMVPSLLGLVAIGMPRRALKQGLVAINFLAVLVVAAIYFGGPRHRSSYDPLLIFLALEVYATLFVLAWRGAVRLRDRLRQRSSSGPRSPQTSSSS